jgi:hypothetical protein
MSPACHRRGSRGLNDVRIVEPWGHWKLLGSVQVPEWHRKRFRIAMGRSASGRASKSAATYTWPRTAAFHVQQSETVPTRTR